MGEQGWTASELEVVERWLTERVGDFGMEHYRVHKWMPMDTLAKQFAQWTVEFLRRDVRRELQALHDASGAGEENAVAPENGGAS